MSEKPCQIVPRTFGVAWLPHPVVGNPKEGLSVIQLKALQALIANSTGVAAAAECGVSKRTLFRRLNEPQFRWAHRKM